MVQPPQANRSRLVKLPPAEYQQIISTLDRVLAFGSVLIVLMQVRVWWTGHASASGVLLLIGTMLLNGLLTYLSSLSESRRHAIELIRGAVINQVLACGAFILVDGPLSPYWGLYLIIALSISPSLFDLTTQRTRLFVHGLNLTNFIATALIFSKRDASFEKLALVGLMIIVTAALNEIVLDILRRSLLSQTAQADELARSRSDLQKKEQLLQAFIDHFPGHAYATSMQGEFLLCNAAAESSFGENVVGKTITETKNRGLFFESPRAEPTSGSTRKTGQAVIAVKNGTEHFATTRFEIFDQGLAVAQCLIAIDITHSKNAEIALEQTRVKMIAASKMSALGEMAGGVAHEINNPLAIIYGKAQRMFEIAEQDLAESKSAASTSSNTALAPVTPLAAIAKDAAKIMTTVERIAKIVAALRSFSRDVDNALFTDARVSQIVSETLELCSARFKAHGIALRPPEIDADLALECRSVEICQVLLNLLNNAHDAIEGVPESWVHLDVRDTGETIDFSVTDSGRGIPLELQEKVLQPFFTTKPIGKGTGLGLSISVGLVGNHGGRLTIDNDCPNTRFVASFPKSHTAPRAALVPNTGDRVAKAESKMAS